MWHLYYGVFICWFFLGPKPGSSRSGSEHLDSLFYHFSPDLVCRPECILYNQKCVSFSSESLWLPNTTQMAVWKTESPNGNRECKNVSLRHLPETCWCIICWEIDGNSNFMGSEKCCFYRESLNFFGLFIKTSQSFYPHQLVHLLG